MANTKKSSGAGAKRSSAGSKGKKTSGGAGKRSTKKNSQGTLGEFVRQREFKAGLVFVIGLLLLIVTLFAGQDGTVWSKIHTFYLALFGLSGCFLPAAVLFLGVVNVLNRHKNVYLIKLLEVFGLIAVVCSLLHVNKVVPSFDEGFVENLRFVYRGIMNYELSALTTGGVIGALFGGALYQMGKSVVLANIILVLLLAALLMLTFGLTLFKLFSGIEKPVKKAGEYTGQMLENARTDLERRRQETAQDRARRESNAGAQAVKVVDDFYAQSGQKKKKTDSVPEKPTDADNAQPGAVPDLKSLFDRVDRRYNGPKKQPGDDTAAGDEPSLNLFDQANGEPGKEPETEKVEPLSEEEARELNEELEGGLEKKPPREYVKPPLDCLKTPVATDKNYDIDELRANGERLIEALRSFNVSATIVDVVPGPTVTRYELSPAPGVKISKFVGLADDLALHMAAPAGLRIEAPIPNKAAIGIEIPNRNKTTVYFREIIDNEDFRGAKSKLNAALGKNISGDVIFSDIAKMPHLLVAGTTGSGKSVCMNTMIVSLLFNAGPDEVKLLLIDPKQVEFGVYNGIPHLLVPVVSDPRKASGALGWAVTEMLSRYKTLNANGVRDIASYNSLCEGNDELEKMPQIVIFIDELADLMAAAPAEVEDSIQRVAQMGRAAGMHLVIATQRPSVDVITGVIKANIPSRIAMTVKSQVDSRTMIDQAGAEKLMGYGDMLYYPVGVPKPIRVQGAYLSLPEIENVVNFLKANGESEYDDEVQKEIERQAAADKKKGAAEDNSSGGLDKSDDLLMRAIELFVSAPEKASISALQRHLGLGFAKAGRLMDTLEEKGIVGPTEGSKPRKVLITKAQWHEMCAMSSEVTNGTVPPGEPQGGSTDGFEDF